MDNYRENADIPEVRTIMGRSEKPKNESKMLEFLIQMLRNPMTSMTQGVPPPPMQPGAQPGMMPGAGPVGAAPPAPPPPNAMPGGGGFNPNNRPGMQGL